jgi:hypothetical protein
VTSVLPLAFSAVLALALLAAPFWPPLAPACVIAGSVGACALALLRRPTRSLRLVLAGLTLWLLAGHAGGWLLRGQPLGGFAWVLLVLYVLPLPLIPWLYWSTFPVGTDRLSDSGPRTPDATGRGGM